jgi:hypothetical protein
MPTWANNPLNATDPLGLFIQPCLSVDGNCSWSVGGTTFLDGVEGTSFPSSLGSNGIGALPPGITYGMAVPGGFAFAQVDATGELLWGFSFQQTSNGVTLTNAALAEMLGLPTGSATVLSAQQKDVLANALGGALHQSQPGRIGGDLQRRWLHNRQTNDARRPGQAFPEPDTGRPQLKHLGHHGIYLQ